MRAAVLVVATLGFAATQAAKCDDAIPLSFDCANARSATEKAICETPSLARRDRDLSHFISEGKRVGGDARRIARSHKEWIAQRNGCGTDADCIEHRYDQWIEEILVALPSLTSLRMPVRPARANAVIELFPYMTPDDFQSITTGENRDALTELSCRYFERSPHDARRLFASHFGSSRDGWQPLCGRISLATAVPDAAGLIADLDKAFGATTDCDGTISHAYARDQTLAEIMAVVDAKPDIALTSLADTSLLDVREDLAGWGEQGLEQKHLAAAIAVSSATATDALTRYYVRHDALDSGAAERAAHYNIAQLIKTYVGRSGASGYCSARADLDRFVASGNVPDTLCGGSGRDAATRQDVLHDLLGLAIIDDYPIDDIQHVIDAGAAIDRAASSPASDDTPLMRAVERIDVLTLLLERGADPDRVNDIGKTALMYAVAEKRHDAVDALIAAHADVNATTKADIECTALKAGKRTALMYAAWHSTPEIVSALIAAGADASAKDTNGDTAASYVAKNTNLSDEDRKRVLDALGEAKH